MAIQTQIIIDRVRQALDAEEVATNPQLGYYDDVKDIIPCINNAIQWLVGVVSSILEDKKFSSELLRELIYTRVWATSGFSRISIDPTALGHSIWSILNVYPKPVVTPDNITPPHPAHQETSIFMGNLSFISGTKTAKRLTIGEWNKNAGNPFQPGNTIFTDQNAPSLIDYAYLGPVNYNSSSYTNQVPPEIEIRPAIPNEFCAIAYIKAPTLSTLGTDNLEFPVTAIDIIYQKALNFLAQKIGDQTTIQSTSDKQLMELIKSII